METMTLLVPQSTLKESFRPGHQDGSHRITKTMQSIPQIDDVASVHETLSIDDGIFPNFLFTFFLK